MCIRDRNTSVDIELQDSERTSWLNPDAAEFVPVSPSRFMTDPDPVSYTHLDVYKRQVYMCVCVCCREREERERER